jgi:hypothetical protein
VVNRFPVVHRVSRWLRQGDRDAKTDRNRVWRSKEVESIVLMESRAEATERPAIAPSSSSNLLRVRILLEVDAVEK